MPSTSFQKWRTSRSDALDEMAQAHVAVGGNQRGRRYTTQQINRSYAVLLASHFQGFCRDLHSECVDHLTSAVTPAPLQPIVRAELTRHRQLDTKNSQPGSIGSDFGRLGVDFWAEVEGHRAENTGRKAMLDHLNAWRNAIVHQSFDPVKLGGTTSLQLTTVRQWRKECGYLARSFDAVMMLHIQTLIGAVPW
jgi:RiboL-PSP-HEPN